MANNILEDRLIKITVPKTREEQDNYLERMKKDAEIIWWKDLRPILGEIDYKGRTVHYESDYLPPERLGEINPILDDIKRRTRRLEDYNNGLALLLVVSGGILLRELFKP